MLPCLRRFRRREIRKLAYAYFELVMLSPIYRLLFKQSRGEIGCARGAGRSHDGRGGAGREASINGGSH